MATTVNQVASPALRGQSVQVTLNSTETGTKLAAITIGQKCTLTSSSKVGYVSSIDPYGNSYQVNPLTPATSMDSASTPGVLAVSETITLV